MNVKRNTTYKRKDLSSDGIIELHAQYKDTPLEATGNTVKIRGKANANRFVVSGQVGDAPTVGSAHLDSAHLRLYVSGTDLSASAVIPTTAIYKIKNNDTTIAEGGFKLAITGDNAPTKRDTPGQMNIYTTYADTNTPYFSESFDGAEKTLGSNFIQESGGGTNLIRMKPYLDPEDPATSAALFIGGTQSWLSWADDDLSTTQVLRKYFSDSQTGTLSEFGDGSAYRLPIKAKDSDKPDGLWKNMLDKRDGSQKFTVYPPFWRWDHIKSLVKYSSETTVPAVASEDAETEPTTNNTMFKTLTMSANNSTAWEGDIENPSPWTVTDMKLSDEKYDTGGQSLKMHHLWNFVKPQDVTTTDYNIEQDALFGLKGATNAQFTCASSDCIPYPIGIDHAFTSGYNSVAGAKDQGAVNLIKPEINIDFSINQMDNNPSFSFPFATRENTANTTLAVAINATATTIEGATDGFTGWPSKGYALLQNNNNYDSETHQGGEYVYFTSRTNTVLTLADRNPLFSTVADSWGLVPETKIYSANEYMQMKNYCSGTIGQVPVAGQFPSSTAGEAAIRSSSYKTLLRNFTVTLSNYEPEQGEPLDEFLDRGLDAFYSGSGDGVNNVVGGFTIQRALGKTNQNDAAASNKVTAYPLFTRPSHYIASGNGSIGGGRKGWNGYIWRGMPMFATSGASALNNVDMTYGAGQSGSPKSTPSARIFINGGARLKQDAITGNLPDEYYEPSVNLSMDEFINAKIVFDMGARNSIDETDSGTWFNVKGGTIMTTGAQRTSEAGMCKVYFTKGFTNYEQDGEGTSIAYNVTADAPPSIPIYFPCLSGSSKAWDWQSTPERWPNILTIWLTNYRFYADDDTKYSKGSSYDSATALSGLTNATNSAGVYRAGYGLAGDFPVTSAVSGSGKSTEAYIDKIELRNFGFEIFNNSASSGVFTLPIGLKSNTVTSPIDELNSGYTMPYPNPMGDKLYVRTAPTYISMGFDDPATLPQTASNNKYSWLMWNGFSQHGYEPDLRYDLFTLQGWKSMVSGAITTHATNAKYVNYFGGQTMQSAKTVLELTAASATPSTTPMAQGYKTPVTVQGLTVDLGQPTGNGTETDKLFFTSGTAMTSLGNDALTQKGTSYMCIQSGGTAGAWAKRENIFVSCAIQDIPSYSSVGFSTVDDIPANTIVVDNPRIFEVVRNETDGPFFMIWKQGSIATTDAKVTQTGKVDGIRSQHLTVKTINGNMITFNQDLGEDLPANLVSLANLPYLRVGPVKYWVTMQVYGGPQALTEAGTTGNLPYKYGIKGGDRTYDNICLLGNTSSPTEALTGSTWNEAVYSYNSAVEATGGRSGAYGKTWILDKGTEGNLDMDNDYGFGAYDEEDNTGGMVAKAIPYVDTMANYDLKGIVENGLSPGDDFKLVIGLEDPQAAQTVEVVNADYSSTDSDILKPHLLWGYKDEVPKINNFSISPLFNVLESGTNLYELTNEDLRSVNFTWEEDADDIWYRLLMIDVSGATIRNKYHNAKFVIKGNELPSLDSTDQTKVLNSPTANPKTHVYDYTTSPVSKTALTAGGTGDSVGADVRSVITGRQGYAIQTNASSTAAHGLISIGAGTNTCLDELNEFTIVLHITPVAADATRSAYLFTYGDDDPGTDDAVYCYIHTDGTIKFVVDGNVLQSISKVAYDGETPMSIILTYNESAPDGKFSKLYIDGVLEDTKTLPIAGPATNGNTVIGGQNLTDAATATNYQGLIEEIIVYNRSYEIPATAGQYTFKAANVDETRGNSVDKKINTNEYLVHSAKLFVFDYTNIRGTTTQEVGSSKQATWKVTSI